MSTASLLGDLPFQAAPVAWAGSVPARTSTVLVVRRSSAGVDEALLAGTAEGLLVTTSEERGPRVLRPTALVSQPGGAAPPAFAVSLGALRLLLAVAAAIDCGRPQIGGPVDDEDRVDDELAELIEEGLIVEGENGIDLAADIADAVRALSRDVIELWRTDLDDGPLRLWLSASGSPYVAYADPDGSTVVVYPPDEEARAAIVDLLTSPEAG